MASQIIDTLIYSLVAWWGVVSLGEALMLGAAKYIFKIGIAIIDTAFIYWARAAFRQRHSEAAAANVA